MAILTSAATVLSMLAFLAICWWAWSTRRQAAMKMLCLIDGERR